MSRKEPPAPFPGPPSPFRMLIRTRRTPETGTLLGLGKPPPLPRAGAAAGAPAAAPAPAQGHDAPELARAAEGLRVELVYFRQWLPGQLVQLSRATRARRRSLQAQALALLAGLALALLLALVSGAAALGWPAYGRLVARAARLPAPTASR